MFKLIDSKAYWDDTALGDAKDLNYIGEGFSISLPDGSMIFIPEQDATVEEKEVFDAYHAAYADTNGIKPVETPSLDSLKLAKIEELWKACNDAILAGFTYNGILYGFDEQDQTNLTQQLALIANGMASEPVYWKGRGETQLRQYTISEFKEIFNAGQVHKDSNMTKYYPLKDAAMNASTAEEVNAIVW